MKVRVWYDTPSRVFEMEEFNGNGGEELLEWIHDNIPIVPAEIIDWDIVRD
jgi:hypothetical protein